jgi:TatD DNase family protein
VGGYLNKKSISLNQIDLKDIVLETDSPHLAPVPFRGKRNEASVKRNR